MPDPGSPPVDLLIDLVDSTWIGAPIGVVAAQVADPVNWRRWWPGLRLRVHEERGTKGMRWVVDGVAGRRAVGLAGSAEVWLEPAGDGVVAHFFLRLHHRNGDARLPAGAAARLVTRYRRAAKRAFWMLGDELDTGRTTRLAQWRPPR